jgi:hypothetical protein
MHTEIKSLSSRLQEGKFSLLNEISSVHKVFLIYLIDGEIRVTYLYYINIAFVMYVNLLISKVTKI